MRDTTAVYLELLIGVIIRGGIGEKKKSLCDLIDNNNRIYLFRNSMKLQRKKQKKNKKVKLILRNCCNNTFIRNSFCN